MQFARIAEAGFRLDARTHREIDTNSLLMLWRRLNEQERYIFVSCYAGWVRVWLTVICRGVALSW